MTRFLLDANLSPKVGRFLTDWFHLDVQSLQSQRLGQMPDHEIIRMVRATGQVIITLDRDFSEYYARTQRPIGIIYLDLPNTLRTVPEINRLLAAFFQHHAADIDLDTSLVVITEHEVRIVRS